MNINYQNQVSAKLPKTLTTNGILCTINRETNSLGVDTITTTEDETGNEISATDGNGNTVNYTYDDINNLIKMSQVVNETSVDVNYTYNNRGDISTITNSNVTYTYAYTPFGNLKSISVGNVALVTYTYIANDDRQLSRLTYANGQTINYNYDSDGIITSVVYKNSDNNVTNTLTYLNDEIGELLKTTDSVNQTVTLTYLDETQVWNTAETQLLYSYSSTDENFNEYVNGTEFITTYSFTDTTDETTALETTETTAFGNMTKTVYLDAFGRVIKEETKNGETVVSSKEYTYNTNGDYVTDQIATEKINIGANSYSYERYTYDENGNITSIENLYSNGEKDTYEYDALGQLVKENTTTVTYDTYGNITKKGAFAYSYEDSNWKDKLTKRLTATITYDEAGNPLNYLGATLTWKNGRELASYTKGTLNVTYDYNESGLRTKKTVNKNGTVTTYNYIWSDDKLTHQTWGNCYMHFYYDYSDEIVGFEYFDGTTLSYYAYIKNMQGDVISIIDSSGNRIADYSYDAWGKLKTATSGIGLINPIRYRGYYYDTEISMYYLQSRYYDPNVGRFINADDTSYIGASKNILSYNIFSYCENSPNFYEDPSGYRIQINCKAFTENGVNYSQKTVKKWLSKISGKSFKLLTVGEDLYEVNYGNIKDADIKLKKSLRTGLRLVYNLLRSDKIIRIDFKKNIGSSKTYKDLENIVIKLSVDRHRNFVYKNNKYKITRSIRYISLAHELIHALLMVKGKANYSTKKIINPHFSEIKSYFKRNNVRRKMTPAQKNFYSEYLTYGNEEFESELQIIGVVNYSPLNGITENAIREENGLGIRVSHFGF